MRDLVIKTVRLDTGERLPLLCTEAGPLYEAAMYTTSLRSRNLAFNTILQALRSISILLHTLDRLKIDLNYRIRTGNLLSANEIDQIVADAHLEVHELNKQADIQINRKRVTKVLSLEQARLNLTRTRIPKQVSSNSTAIRLTYINNYLRWHIQNRVHRLDSDFASRSQIIELGKLIEKRIIDKTPRHSGNINGERLGLKQKAQDAVISAIEPANPINPWSHQHSKERNALIIHMLLELGMRRSEILGLRINDIDSTNQEVRIELRPDDAEDPRLYEPNGKTRARILPISPTLINKISNYKNGTRYDIKRARRHPFLLVASNGDPLSISGFAKIFTSLQKSNPDFSMIFAHLLRHTFNDNLVSELKNSGLTDAQIHTALCRINGWSDASLMPFKYTKQSSEDMARKILKAYQSKLG
jgi:integrase